MSEAHTPATVLRASSGGVFGGQENSSGPQRLSLTLDNSNMSTASVAPAGYDRAGDLLSVIPDEKRRILEARMTNASSASIIESVVGFSNDSRGESSGQGHSSYVPGAPSSPTATSRSATVFVHGVVTPAPAANAPGRAAASEDLPGASGGKDREPSGASGGKQARTARGMEEVAAAREEARGEKESFSAEELPSSEDEDSSSAGSNGDSRGAMSNASEGGSRGPIEVTVSDVEPLGNVYSRAAPFFPDAPSSSAACFLFFLPLLSFTSFR
ncbi:hypothetical protein T484DRAFT_1893003 [Baffinella frigidus]|nr:hypothetical protein T484DRAFT_1893003 [Cryptophyta sp. CCMP2293]